MFTVVSAVLVTGCTKKEEVQEPKSLENTIAAVHTYAGIKVSGLKDATNDSAQFYSPNGIANVQNIIYVADTSNHAIRKIENGKTITITGSFDKKDEFGKPIGGYKDGALADALFNTPTDLVVADDDTIYVTDSNNGAIRKITPEGQVETVVNNLKYPSHIAIDRNNTLFVTEKLAHRILQISEQGEVTVIAGGHYDKEDNELIGAYKDGVGENAQFNEPTGIALAEDGYLYISDTGNQRIRKVELNGTVSTIAGSGDSFLDGTKYIAGDYKNGDALKARFNFPQGLALSKDGFLLIADTLNHSIRVLSQDGQVTTLSGNGTHGKTDGTIAKATFDGPTDITVDADGILVADQYNNAIRLLSFKENKEVSKQ